MTAVPDRYRPLPGWIEWLAAGLSLRQRILLLLSVAGLPGMAIAFYLAASGLANEARQIETGVDRLARLGAAQHENVIGNARVLLEAVAQGQDPERIDPAECRAYMKGWLARFPGFTSLAMFDANGRIVCADRDRELPYRASEESWFAKVREERTFVLGSYSIGEGGTPLLAAAYPVRGRNERFLGVVALGIDLRWLDFVAQAIQLPANGTISAISREGELLSHNVARTENDEPKAAPPSASAIAQMAVLAGGTIRAEDASGNPRIYGFQKTASGGVSVVVGLPPYLQSARYGEALFNALAAPLMILFLALVAAGYASEAFVTRYVRGLTKTAESIAEGDFSARTDIPYDTYEIGQLAHAFDEMAETIESNQSELQGLVKERDTLIRELNHRVKNNLQIMLSLLQMGERNVTAEAAQARLKSLTGRVRTLAEVHRLLYQEFEERPLLVPYLQRLAKLLADFYDLKINVADADSLLEPVSMKIGQSISVGLILNELIANARKHAFPDDREGTVDLRLALESENREPFVHMIIEDDGVGLPAGFDFSSSRSTGARVVNALARQLAGTIWHEPRTHGTAIHVRFPLPPAPNGKNPPS